MRTLLVIVALILPCGLACVSKSKARAQAQAAFQAGQQQAGQLPMTNVVIVRGEVRMPVVPWVEDLTLARALVAADYSALADPREILIIRRGVAQRVDIRKLLSGAEDPLLEPGDIIEIWR
jgi:hypothetical protein